MAALPSYGQGRDHVGARRTAFIGGVNLRDVTVTAAEGSRAVIDAQGEPWWACHCKSRSVFPDKNAKQLIGSCRGDWNASACVGKELYTRGHLLEFMHSSEIEISNLQLRNR